MRTWIVIVPLALLAACSRPNTPPTTGAQSAPAQAPAQVPAQTQAQAPPQPAPTANPEPVEPPPSAPPAASAAAPPENVREAAVRPAVVIPRGARLRVRLDQTIDTRRNRPGDAFTATLSAPLLVNSDTVLPTGTRVRGHVTESAASGRMKGRARLGVTLDSFHAAGREHAIHTSAVERVGAAHKKRNGILIGGGAGLGAAIGAIAGGGKGAAIGALAGAGAGTAGAAATGKEELTLPAETALVFTLRAPVRME
jgi:hypothetical protein